MCIYNDFISAAVAHLYTCCAPQLTAALHCTLSCGVFTCLFVVTECSLMDLSPRFLSVFMLQ